MVTEHLAEPAQPSASEGGTQREASCDAGLRSPRSFPRGDAGATLHCSVPVTEAAATGHGRPAARVDSCYGTEATSHTLLFPTEGSPWLLLQSKEP